MLGGPRSFLVALTAAAVLIAGCSSESGESDTTDAPPTTVAPPGESTTTFFISVDPPPPSDDVPAQATAADVAAVCAPMFEAWSAGDDHELLGLMLPEAAAVLDEHPFGLGFFGLHSSGTDCFISGVDDLGALASLAEVTVAMLNGSPVATAIDWREIGDVDASTIERYEAATELFAPSLEGSDPGDATTTTPEATAGTLVPLEGDALFEYELLARSCVYDGDATACDQLTAQYSVDASSNFGLGNSLTQAPSDALAAECSFELRGIACAELRTRFAIGPDDEDIARRFADAVVAGDTAAIATLSDPRVSEEVGIGPFDPALQDGLDIPGVFFIAADSSFQFTTQATVFYTCWVGDGLVQVCQFAGD